MILCWFHTSFDPYCYFFHVLVLNLSHIDDNVCFCFSCSFFINLEVFEEHKLHILSGELSSLEYLSVSTSDCFI